MKQITAWMGPAVVALLLLGCGQPEQRVIGVRPAVPEGARGMVAEARRQEQQRQKMVAQQNSPSFGEKLKALFDPKQWGRQPQPQPSQPGPQQPAASAVPPGENPFVYQDPTNTGYANQPVAPGYGQPAAPPAQDPNAWQQPAPPAQ